MMDETRLARIKELADDIINANVALLRDVGLVEAPAQFVLDNYGAVVTSSINSAGEIKQIIDQAGAATE